MVLPCNSAREPISRILSCAVIPLGAALPRTLISDLPGGFGHCMQQPLKAPLHTRSTLAAPGRHRTRVLLQTRASLPIWSCSVWGLPCPRRYRRSGALLPHHFTLTPALEFTQRRAFPASRAHSGIAFPGSPSRKRGSRGGIFSVALAVHAPSSARPGRYPAHCPAEFGLSSPEEPSPKRDPPAATAQSSCQPLVYSQSRLPNAGANRGACASVSPLLASLPAPSQFASAGPANPPALNPRSSAS